MQKCNVMYGVSYQFSPMSVWNMDSVCRDLGITFDDVDTETIYVRRNEMSFSTKDGKHFGNICPDELDAMDAGLEFKYPHNTALTKCDVDEDDDVDYSNLADLLYKEN
jgi:hypothetical protein